MIRLSYRSTEAAHASRRDAGWLANPDGTYSHRRAMARIEGSTVIIAAGTTQLNAEVCELIGDIAARREHDARRRA
jgi:hypothetical protein